jgi:hypothetical protein
VVKASLRWLNNVSGVSVLRPGFPAFYWSAGFGTFLQVPGPASHWLENCANFTPSPETTNTVPTTLSAIQATSQSTFVNAASN